MLKLTSKHLLLLEKALKYLVSAIILAIPLYPKFPFITVPGTFVAIRLEDFLIACVALVWFVWGFSDIKKLVKNPVTISVLLFLSIGLLSVLSAVLILETVSPLIALLHWLRRIEYFIPLLIGMTLIYKRPEYLNFFFKSILIVLLISFIYGFGQKNFDFPIIITQNQEYSKGVALKWREGAHVNATFAGHYDLASYLVLMIPVVISSALLVKGKLSKVFLILIYLLSLWLLVNTASRISIISYLASVTVTLFLIEKLRYMFPIVFISLVFMFFSTNLLDRYERILEVTKDRLSTFTIYENVYAQDDPIRRNTPTPVPPVQTVFEDRSTSIRLNVEWPRAIRAFYKSPLLGTGYSSISLATDNNYLRMLGEIGLLGFIAWINILLNIFNVIFKKYSFLKSFEGLELAFVSGVVGAFVGILINALFIDIFAASKFAINLWLIMGFVLGIVLKAKNEKNKLWKN